MVSEIQNFEDARSSLRRSRKIINSSWTMGKKNFLKLLPPPPSGTAILPEYIHYYGYYYSLSRERLGNIKVTKFYVEQGVASARKI
jgi:hypothetical protein